MKLSDIPCKAELLRLTRLNASAEVGIKQGSITVSMHCAFRALAGSAQERGLMMESLILGRLEQKWLGFLAI